MKEQILNFMNGIVNEIAGKIEATTNPLIHVMLRAQIDILNHTLNEISKSIPDNSPTAQNEQLKLF